LTPISNRHSVGTILVETLVAVLLATAFFATIFELNAVCLRYIQASKESVAALQGVQDRLEALRNLTFRDLTSADVANNPNCVPNLMQNPANGSELTRELTEGRRDRNSAGNQEHARDRLRTARARYDVRA
jgi:hypothetical protein